MPLEFQCHLRLSLIVGLFHLLLDVICVSLVNSRFTAQPCVTKHLAVHPLSPSRWLPSEVVFVIDVSLTWQ